MAYGNPPGYGAPQGYGGVRLPQSVNIASILLFIAGGFAILGGLLLFAVASALGAFVIVAVILLALGAFEIYTGIQLRKLVPWARTVTIVLAAIGALFDLLSIFKGAFSSIIGLGLNVYIIYLMYRPETVAAFPASNRPAGI